MKKTLLSLILSLITLTTHAIEKLGHPITINNQSNAVVIINEAMMFGGYCANVTIDNAQTVTVQKNDGTLLTYFTEDDLASIKTIHISFDHRREDYLIETEQAIQPYVSVTINNYPDDTEVVVNGIATITPTRKNIQINGVKNVLIQTVQGRLIKLYTLMGLQAIKKITINKNSQTGEHIVETE